MSIVRSPKSQPQHSVSELPRCRRRSVIDTAKSAGLLNDENGRITVVCVFEVFGRIVRQAALWPGKMTV